MQHHILFSFLMSCVTSIIRVASSTVWLWNSERGTETASCLEDPCSISLNIQKHPRCSKDTPEELAAVTDMTADTLFTPDSEVYGVYGLGVVHG